MKRKFSTLLAALAMLFTFAPTASAAVTLSCSELGVNNRHAEEQGTFRTGVTHHEAIRMMNIYGQDTSHPALQTCVNTGFPVDATTMSSVYISIEPQTGGGVNDILQIGMARCGDPNGCNEEVCTDPGCFNIPGDGKLYWWWAWGRSGIGGVLPHPQRFQDVNGHAIDACNGEAFGTCYGDGQQWAIYRQCGQNQFSQTDCNEATNVTPNLWVVAATHAFSPNCVDPEVCPDVTATVLESDIPWIEDTSKHAVGSVACETWDQGDACGGVSDGSFNNGNSWGSWSLDGIMVKDSTSGPGTGTWMSPKFTKNSCDIQGMSTYVGCSVSQGNGDFGVGGMRVETFNTR